MLVADGAAVGNALQDGPDSLLEGRAGGVERHIEVLATAGKILGDLLFGLHRVSVVPGLDVGAEQAAEVLTLVVQAGGISKLQQAQALRAGTGLHGAKRGLEGVGHQGQHAGLLG